jgi:hypothetical protein
VDEGGGQVRLLAEALAEPLVERLQAGDGNEGRQLSFPVT